MDDDLEDEVFLQTLLVHGRLLSGVVRGFAATYISIPLGLVVGRRLTFYHLFRPETIAVAILLLLTAAAFLGRPALLPDINCKWYNTLWVRVQRATLSARLPSLGIRHVKAVDNVSLPIVAALSGRAKTWELKQDIVAVYAVQGRRPNMEDRFSVSDVSCLPLRGMSGDDGLQLYGVFDGHGGDSAADFVEKYLFKNLISRVKNEKQCFSDGGDGNINEECDFAQILTKEMLTVDEQLLAKMKASKDLAGTTALVALVYRNKLVVANVGDSRGVVCDCRGATIPLSFDHKPQQLKEQKRIKQAGGFVAFNGVWRVAGILATSRALGDYPLKDRKLIIADPDVLTFNLDDLKPRFMILASDGLWDTFTNEEAISFVRSRLDEPHFGAKSLTMQAYQRGSLDNITVMVVVFKNYTR